MADITQKLDGVLENEPMKKHTTFKIGGPARYFFVAKNNDDLVKALKVADELGLETFVLGGGSNLLVSDQGINALVIKLENRKFEINGELIRTDSGVLVHELLLKTLEAGLCGWAWASGLPGTIGGAIRGNAGAYGEGMADIVQEVEVYIDSEVKTFSKEEMAFSYRHSAIKNKKATVVSALLKLKKGDTTEDQALVEKYLQYRHDTQPLDLPNSGCIFKNVDLTKVKLDKQKLMKAMDIDEAEFIQKTKYNKLPVSYIMQQLGFKGHSMGDAAVSDKHGAFIVNKGNATAEQVIMLMSDLKMKVRNELGIQLEEEVQLVGF